MKELEFYYGFVANRHVYACGAVKLHPGTVVKINGKKRGQYNVKTVSGKSFTLNEDAVKYHENAEKYYKNGKRNIND